jgi:hypothetical protein
MVDILTLILVLVLIVVLCYIALIGPVLEQENHLTPERARFAEVNEPEPATLVVTRRLLVTLHDGSQADIREVLEEAWARG